MSPILNIVGKDILFELRHRESTLSMVSFSVLILMIFHFAIGTDLNSMQTIAPGLLWVCFLFMALLHLNRSFQEESQQIDGLLLSPLERDKLYLAKVLSTLIFIFISQLLTTPVFAAFFNLNIFAMRGLFIGLLVLGNIGIACIGVLFSAMALNIRAREVMLPLLMFPVLVPILLSVVQASNIVLLEMQPISAVWPWLKILVGFDLIFLVIGILTFETIMEK